MGNLTEVFFPETEQRRAVEFRIAADVVIGVRMELFAILVVPHLFGLVLSFEVYGAGIPVVFFTRNVSAAFQEQNALAGGSQSMGERAAAGAGADNDHIEMVLRGHFPTPLSGSEWLLCRTCAGSGYSLGGFELDEVFRKEQIEGPTQSDAHFLLQARQLAQVNSAPQPPGNESREVDAHDVRYSGSPPDCGKLADGGENKGLLCRASKGRDDVACQHLSLAQRVLSRRWIKLAGLRIANRRAISQRPHARPAGNFQCAVDDQFPLLLWTRQRR